VVGEYQLNFSACSDDLPPLASADDLLLRQHQMQAFANAPPK
jgi:hypothetical protein